MILWRIRIIKKVVCCYWNIDFKYNNVRNPIIEDIKVKLIRNYNILEGVSDSDIIGILNFSQDKCYEIIPAPLIAHLGKNFNKGNDTLISGDELLKMAVEKIEEAQKNHGREIYIFRMRR